MIFPVSNRSRDVNTAMIRIAAMNNEDIDFMQQEVKRLQGRQDELNARFDSQKTRWQKYRESYRMLLNMFNMLQGNMDYEDLIPSLPWYGV